jgi:hypothetical protein
MRIKRGKDKPRQWASKPSLDFLQDYWGKFAKSSTTDRDLLKSNYDLKLEALLEERKAREKS